MRAYRYQVLASMSVWLDLKEGEVLYLEGAEDFDRLAPDAPPVVTQVKDTASSGSLTLRTSGAVEAISNYWEHCSRNPESRIRFDYLTTSKVGNEQGAPFGKSISGIDLWRRAQESADPEEAKADARRIANFLLEESRRPKESKISDKALDFLRNARDEDILTKLIKPIRWITAADETSALIGKIRDQLVERLASRSVSSLNEEKVLAALERRIWEVVTQSSERMLSRADLIRVIDASTMAIVTESALIGLLEQVHGSGRLSPLFRSGVQAEPPGSSSELSPLLDVERVERSFGAASRVLLEWPQETDGHWIKRPELEQLHARTMQAEPTVTILLGGPGEGKSALLARLGKQLAAEGAVLLALKADQIKRTVGTLGELDSWIRTPVPVTDALRQLAADRRVVLLIDQLDALAELMDQHSERLSVLLDLVRAVHGTKNLHVLLSCREFEFRNDIRLNSLDAKPVTLSRLTWEQVLPLLAARRLDPTAWSEEVRDVLRTPQHLTVFLTHMAKKQENQVGAPAFTTYQVLLEQVVKERIEIRYGPKTLEAAKRIAVDMAKEEELWLARVRFEREYGLELRNLEAAEFLVSSGDGLSLSFRHQTLFDFLRARAFLYDGISISAHVITEKQESLFVRPILWSALHYLRGADRATYRREFQVLWANESLRPHLRYLLVAFLGQLGDPDDQEAQWFMPAVDNPDLRPKALRAMAGSRGWFGRLRSRLPALMVAPPEEASDAFPVLAKAVVFERDVVLELTEKYWMPHVQYIGHAVLVMQNVQFWDQRSLSLALKLAGSVHAMGIDVQQMADCIAHFRPDLAPAVVVRQLETRLERLDLESEDIPSRPPEDATGEQEVAHHGARSDSNRGCYKQLLNDYDDWHGIDRLAVRVPKEFLDNAWPWLLAVLGRLVDDSHSVLTRYRTCHDLAFDRQDESRQAPLVGAFEAAMRVFPERDLEAFLEFVSSNKSSEFMVVHRLLLLGLERIVSLRPKVVLDYLLEDARRLAIGGYEDEYCCDSRRLISCVLPCLSDGDALRLEEAVTSWPLCRETPVDDDASIRRYRRDLTRKHRLRLLREFPDARLSVNGRRHRQQEERALPHVQDYENQLEVGFIGSPMSAAQMAKAKDEEIVSLFEEITDSTGWSHPRGRWTDFVGGSVQASHEFAEFAKTHPNRAIRIMEEFRPDRQEGPAGAALVELGRGDLVPAEVLMNIIHALAERGFGSTEFRRNVARCLIDISQRTKGLDDKTCAMLEGWIEEWNPGSSGPDGSGGHPEKEESSQSLLWNRGGWEQVAGGNYHFLEALRCGYLRRASADANGWLASLERHLVRRENPRIWICLARELRWLGHADRDRAIRFFVALFERVPEILRSSAGVCLIAYVHGWIPSGLYAQTLERWLSGDWRRGPQAAGEIAALRLCHRPDEATAREQVDRFISSAGYSAAVAGGLRLGVAYTLVSVWMEQPLRALTTPLLMRLLPCADEALAKVLHRIFAKVAPLPADEYTRRFLNALLEYPVILTAGSSRFVVNHLGTLLREGWEPELIHEIASALVGEVGRGLGNIHTKWSRSSGELVELALTLHRLSGTRSRGLELFERLMAVDAYKVNERLALLDRRPFR